MKFIFGFEHTNEMKNVNLIYESEKFIKEIMENGRHTYVNPCIFDKKFLRDPIKMSSELRNNCDIVLVTAKDVKVDKKLLEKLSRPANFSLRKIC